MHSRFSENTAADVLEKLRSVKTKERNGNKGQKRERQIGASIMFCRIRRCSSADVSAAYDPLYETYFEKKCRVSFGGR